MAETKTTTGEATVAFAEETSDYLNRVSGVWVANANQAVEATQRVLDTWTQLGQQFAPVLAKDYAVPSPKQLVDTSVEIGARVLDFQRQIAHQLIDGFGTLYSSDDQPAPEKAAQRANEVLQQAGDQVEQARDEAQQKAQQDGEQDGEQDGRQEEKAQQNGEQAGGVSAQVTVDGGAKTQGRGRTGARA